MHDVHELSYRRLWYEVEKNPLFAMGFYKLIPRVKILFSDSSEGCWSSCYRTHVITSLPV